MTTATTNLKKTTEPQLYCVIGKETFAIYLSEKGQQIRKQKIRRLPHIDKFCKETGAAKKPRGNIGGRITRSA